MRRWRNRRRWEWGINLRIVFKIFEKMIGYEYYLIFDIL